MKAKTLLIATDFSNLSQEAVEVGVTLARALGAKVLLMHSIDSPDDRDVLSAAYDDYYAYTRDQISGALEELGKKIEGKKLEVELLLVDGVPHQKIVSTAKERGADMIVMGTHGRRGWDRLVMGSQAEHVVRTAPCPVITVRGISKPAQRPAKRAPAEKTPQTRRGAR